MLPAEYKVLDIGPLQWEDPRLTFAQIQAHSFPFLHLHKGTAFPQRFQTGSCSRLCEVPGISLFVISNVIAKPSLACVAVSLLLVKKVLGGALCFHTFLPNSHAGSNIISTCFGSSLSTPLAASTKWLCQQLPGRLLAAWFHYVP